MFKKSINLSVGVMFFSLFLNVFVALGNEYRQIEPVPGRERRTDFIEYLGDVYGFGISISAILAIFMIAFGAFIYIVTSAGNSAKMADAKDMIFNAIYGLIIALIAYLILFVVNPDLVGGVIHRVPTARDFLH